MLYPKSIDTLSDIQLIQNIKIRKCSDSLIELASRHQGLFNKIKNRFSNSLDCNTLTDISLERHEILYYSVKTYKKSLGAFTTWYGSCIKNHILNILNQIKRDNKFLTELGEWTEEVPWIETVEIVPFAKTVISKLIDSRARKVMNLKFLNNLSYREIGLKMGIAPQTALNIYNKNKEELKIILQKQQNML